MWKLINCHFLNLILLFLVRYNEQCYDLINYLVKQGADLNVKNVYGKTVLDFSVQLINSSIMDYLIKSNAKQFDVESVENSLMYVASNGKQSLFIKRKLLPLRQK